MKSLLKITFLALLILPSMGQAQKIEIIEPINLLTLGDSYTIGESVSPDKSWPEQLKHSLSELYKFNDLKIIAKTGWRTDQLISAISQQNPIDFNLVSVLIGVNNQYQGRVFSDMQRDFENLVEEAISRAGGEKQRVFIVSIPDYAYTPFGQTKDHEKISREIDQYNEWQEQYAQKEGISYVNITSISRKGIDSPELVAKDGLHPSGQQYTLWVEKIMNELFN